MSVRSSRNAFSSAFAVRSASGARIGEEVVPQIRRFVPRPLAGHARQHRPRAIVQRQLLDLAGRQHAVVEPQIVELAAERRTGRLAADAERRIRSASIPPALSRTISVASGLPFR